MASFTLAAILCAVVLSSMTLGNDLEHCQGPCPEDWIYHDGRCFHHIAEAKTWLEAELNCQMHGGNLASERSEDDHQFLRKLHATLDSKNGPFWLGLSELRGEKTWLWSDGTSLVAEGAFSKWNSGEPNNAGGHEDCVHTNFGGQGDWNDISCDAKYPSICVLRYN